MVCVFGKRLFNIFNGNKKIQALNTLYKTIKHHWDLKQNPKMYYFGSWTKIFKGVLKMFAMVFTLDTLPMSYSGYSLNE